MQRNARRKMSPTPRRRNQRGQRSVASPAPQENSFALCQSRASDEPDDVAPTTLSLRLVSLAGFASKMCAGLGSGVLSSDEAERSEAGWRRFLDTASGLRRSTQKGKLNGGV